MQMVQLARIPKERRFQLQVASLTREEFAASHVIGRLLTVMAELFLEILRGKRGRRCQIGQSLTEGECRLQILAGGG